jgi:hypothetical protein
MSTIQRIFNRHLLWVLPLFIIPGCKNTIDINAKWKEIVVVYATLDATDTVQYVRVEKAFLDPKTGALQTARIADSFILQSAIVTLSSAKGVDTLRRINYMPKDSGIFANDKNPIFKTNKKLDSSVEYRIDVVDSKTGIKVWAKTVLVWPCIIRSPVHLSTTKFTFQQEFINVSFIPGLNSYAYDVAMKVYYDEFTQGDTTTKTAKTAVWNMVTNQPVEPGVEIRILIPKLAFFQFLSSSIAQAPGLKHRLKYIDMTWFGGGQSLVDYISVNQPSIGIVQKTAEYTNIQGGFGIFSSRCKQTIGGVGFDGASVDLLINSEVTKALNIIH